MNEARAVFIYDHDAVCVNCGGQNVHYNAYVKHGSSSFLIDLDCPVWCRDCECETEMVDADCYEPSE